MNLILRFQGQVRFFLRGMLLFHRGSKTRLRRGAIVVDLQPHLAVRAGNPQQSQIPAGQNLQMVPGQERILRNLKAVRNKLRPVCGLCKRLADGFEVAHQKDPLGVVRQDGLVRGGQLDQLSAGAVRFHQNLVCGGTAGGIDGRGQRTEFSSGCSAAGCGKAPRPQGLYQSLCVRIQQHTRFPVHVGGGGHQHPQSGGAVLLRQSMDEGGLASCAHNGGHHGRPFSACRARRASTTPPAMQRALSERDHPKNCVNLQAGVE